MPVLISGVYILHLLSSDESLVSSGKAFSIGKVSRWLLRVKRMVSAQPSSHSNSILLPLPWAGVRNIPLCKGGSLPVCPCRTQIWVTELLSSLCLTNPGREKRWHFEWAYLCLRWNMDFFVLSFVHWVCLTRQGGGWPCMNCRPVFLHCPESTVICPPESEAPVSAATHSI